MTDNQRENLKELKNPRIQSTTPHSARTRACFWREAPPFPLVPTAIGRVLVRVSSLSLLIKFHEFELVNSLEGFGNEGGQTAAVCRRGRVAGVARGGYWLPHLEFN